MKLDNYHPLDYHSVLVHTHNMYMYNVHVYSCNFTPESVKDKPQHYQMTQAHYGFPTVDV